ncbi:hypothetical protein B484DRAFT_412382 [Ochromonadaceae sp. CCMP2298]|nr:hypothetical protein B484DRAFT_412382 [Ochromonadaceae sp. CCMP2298]
MLQPLWCVCVAVLLRSAFSLPSLPRSAWTATTRTLTNPYTKTTPIRPSTRLRDSDILPAGENTTDLALGFAQLEPFLKIAVPFFKEDKTARNSLLGVTGLTLLNSGISVAFSYISRDL